MGGGCGHWEIGVKLKRVDKIPNTNIQKQNLLCSLQFAPFLYNPHLHKTNIYTKEKKSKDKVGPPFPICSPHGPSQLYYKIEWLFSNCPSQSSSTYIIQLEFYMPNPKKKKKLTVYLNIYILKYIDFNIYKMIKNFKR